MDWLVSVTHLVIHGAADEVAAGRLTPDDASRVIRETLLGAFTRRDTGDS
ncbi:hypothetical protein ACFQ0B_45205 [Nonomuraea thailandensis]